MAEGRPPDSRPATVHGAERLTAGSRDRPREQPTGGVSAVRRALADHTDMSAARKNLDSNEINIRYLKNLSMPAVD